MTLPGFRPCLTCMGTGGVRVPCYRCMYSDRAHSHNCSDCQGTGQVPDDPTVEVVADGIADLPFDILELRNWGEEPVADPYIVAARAALVAYAKLHGREI